MKLDVLVMAAHRDDIEIVCGGTVIKLVDLGHKVGILDCLWPLSRAGRSHDPDPGDWPGNWAV